MASPENGVKVVFSTKVLVVDPKADTAFVYKVGAHIGEDERVKLTRCGENGGSIDITLAALLRGRRRTLRFYFVNSGPGILERRFDNQLF